MLINDYINGGFKMIDPISFCRYICVFKSNMGKTAFVIRWHVANTLENITEFGGNTVLN